MQAPTQEAVDYYLSSGFSRQGERTWLPDEIPADAAPFKPIALRIKDHSRKSGGYHPLDRTDSGGNGI